MESSGELVSALIIPCAGKSSRFESSTPKPLAQFKNRPILRHILDYVAKDFNKVYVTIPRKSKHFEEYNELIMHYENTSLYEVESGLGDGDAVLNTILSIAEPSPKIYGVLWGDVLLLNDYIISHSLKYFCNPETQADFFIPLKYVKEPYVFFQFNDFNKIHSVGFQRKGQFVTEGYTDHCFFLFNNKTVEVLQSYAKSISNKNRYSTYNGEFNLLESISFINLSGLQIEHAFMNRYKDIFSFNTLEEFSRIERIAKK